MGPFRRRGFWVGVEVAVVLALLGVWLGSEAIRSADHLAILFLYSFPSEFLVGLVPHEPVLIHYGGAHPAWVVVAVAGVGTVMAEAVNYSIFGYVYLRPTLQDFSGRPAVRRITKLFARRPFATVVLAGFTPVPFFPVRFLVVMTAYPLGRYLAGVALSRVPRFYLLAVFGQLFDVPGGLLLFLMGVMLATVNLPAAAALLRRPQPPEVDEPLEALPWSLNPGAAPTEPSAAQVRMGGDDR